MNKLNFTKKALEKLPAAPNKTPVPYHDTQQPGLVLRVTDKGTKTFYQVMEYQFVWLCHLHIGSTHRMFD